MDLPDLTWKSPPPGLTLAGDAVHVWRASLDQPSRLEDLWLTLSADEQRRASAFHFEQDRRRFIVGRGVLRSILGLYLYLDPSRLQFRYGPWGKPALVASCGGDALSFNLAHSGPLVVYALARSRVLGIDVEQVRPLPDADRIAAAAFSVRENAAYSALPPEQKQRGFYQCWTLKEAYVKALGEGLVQDWGSFDVSFAPGEQARLLHAGWDPGQTAAVSLISFMPLPGFVAALAVRGADPPIVCWDWA